MTERLLREPSRDAGWMARWQETYRRHQEALARWRFMQRRRN